MLYMLYRPPYMTIKQRFNVILDGLYPYKHRIDPLKSIKTTFLDHF